MPKTQNQPLEQSAPPEVAIKKEKHQKAEISEEESSGGKHQTDETAE